MLLYNYCLKASGRWYLVATKKQDMREKAQRKSMTPECGGNYDHKLVT